MTKPIAIFLFAAMTLAGGSSAAVTVALKEDFEASEAAAAWTPCAGFSIVEGAGIGGSRGLVWEQAKSRPMKMDAPPPVDGNAVRPVPTAVPERFVRELPLEPGRIYTFSVKINGLITNNCAYVFLSWFDKGGTLIGRAEGRPTIYKEAGRKGWEIVKAATQRLPSNAVRGKLMIELYRTTLGRMAFDDFEVTCDEPRHVERLFSSAYRNAQESGRVRFVVPYVAAEEKFPKEGLSGAFTFIGPDGAPFTLPADVFADDHFEITVDVARLAPGSNTVKACLSFRGNELGTAALDFTRGKIERAVTFDQRQRLIVEGKPFFPLGVYVHPADKEVPYRNRLTNTPFNCIIECSADRRMLDKFHAAGLKAIPKAPWNPKWAEPAAKNLRRHPALLAWYVIDETPADRADEKRALQRTLEAADPDHPTFAVLDRPRNADALMGAFDIVSTDPYPIGRGRGPISRASEYPRLCRAKTWGLRPLWQVPQSMAWEWFHKYGFPKENRYPRYDELRSMTWQAIAGGANGLLYYSAHHIFKCSPPEELEANWSTLVKVAGEVKSYVDVLLSEEVSVTSSSPALVVRAFRTGGETWVLVVNSTREPATGAIDVAGQKLEVTLSPLGVEFKVLRGQTLQNDCRAGGG